MPPAKRGDTSVETVIDGLPEVSDFTVSERALVPPSPVKVLRTEPAMPPYCAPEPSVNVLVKVPPPTKETSPSTRRKWPNTAPAPASIESSPFCFRVTPLSPVLTSLLAANVVEDLKFAQPMKPPDATLSVLPTFSGQVKTAPDSCVSVRSTALPMRPPEAVVPFTVRLDKSSALVRVTVEPVAALVSVVVCPANPTRPPAQPDADSTVMLLLSLKSLSGEKATAAPASTSPTKRPALPESASMVPPSLAPSRPVTFPIVNVPDETVFVNRPIFSVAETLKALRVPVKE